VEGVKYLSLELLRLHHDFSRASSHLPLLFSPHHILMLTVPSGGGMRTTTNRTLWPVQGGAVAIQPGWFQGHATAFFYINLGFGTNGPDDGPQNFSNPMVSVFQISGPSKGPYPGTFCLPQVPLPVNATVNIGDNATIQVVETAVHGAALFNVSFLSISTSLSHFSIPYLPHHHISRPP
jgi:hypothetical protein